MPTADADHDEQLMSFVAFADIKHLLASCLS